VLLRGNGPPGFDQMGILWPWRMHAHIAALVAHGHIAALVAHDPCP